MPVFDYLCSACGHCFEKTVIASAGEKVQDVIECPHCSNTTAKKKIGGSGVSFRLYGEGFSKRSHRNTGDFAD